MACRDDKARYPILEQVPGTIADIQRHSRAAPAHGLHQDQRLHFAFAGEQSERSLIEMGCCPGCYPVQSDDAVQPQLVLEGFHRLLLRAPRRRYQVSPRGNVHEPA